MSKYWACWFLLACHRHYFIQFCIENAYTYVTSSFHLDAAIETVQPKIEEFAHEGLRTLCVAKRVGFCYKLLCLLQ